MLEDVFNEKKRIYMAFLRREGIQSHLRQFNLFFDVFALYYIQIATNTCL